MPDSPSNPVVQRVIYAHHEPVILFAVFDAAKTVKLDVIDPDGDTSLLADETMTESAVLTGAGGAIYTYTLTPAVLGGLIDPSTERLFAWRARLDPAEAGIVDEFGTFYRGGYVEQRAVPPLITTSFATSDDNARNLKVGMIDYIEYPIGYGKAVRHSFSYVAGTGIVASKAETEVDLP